MTDRVRISSIRKTGDHHADMHWKLEDAIWWIGKADKL